MQITFQLCKFTVCEIYFMVVFAKQTYKSICTGFVFFHLWQNKGSIKQGREASFLQRASVVQA